MPAAGELDERTGRRTRPDAGDGDHDRFAHYVDKVDMTRSAVTGEAVVALCGKKWVPTRDAENYPICPACREVYARLS
ncbi:MAG TPA: DUF3039 domain-containing protein [Acidimicrobiaceae bacterium]|nr:DUF3039 domain-containing protein [Acidimicrobiaceae bacterium]